MTILYQRGRIYSLIVGDPKTTGWEITDLNITFDIIKTSSNKDKVNGAVIEIWNLSREKQALLEQTYIAAVLSVGYVDTGLKRIFAGQITFATTRKSGPDVITQIRMGSNYVELNQQTLKNLVPPGKKVEDVAKEIANQIPGVSKTIFAGVNIGSPIIDGYPLSGTPREQLDEISRTYDVEWSIDDGTLYIADAGGTHTTNVNDVLLINQDTGLIERPYAASGEMRRANNDKAKKKGIQFKMLCNAEIIPGALIKLEYENLTGYYKVDSVRHYGEYRGTDWYSDVRLTAKVG